MAEDPAMVDTQEDVSLSGWANLAAKQLVFSQRETIVFSKRPFFQLRWQCALTKQGLYGTAQLSCFVT